MDPYEVLGVEATATQADLRRAYLQLARRHHPDGHAVHGAEAVARAERRMQEVNAAWSIVGDSASRAEFDEGRATGGPRVGPAVVRPAAGPTWRPRVDDTGWMDDFEAWKQEDHDWVPPERPRPPSRQLVTVLPVVVFCLSVACGCVGLAVGARGLVAGGLVGVMLAGLLLVGITLLELRGRPSR